MASRGHKAASGLVSQQLGMGEQPVTQAVEGQALVGGQGVVEFGFILERDRHDLRLPEIHTGAV